MICNNIEVPEVTVFKLYFYSFVNNLNKIMHLPTGSQYKLSVKISLSSNFIKKGMKLRNISKHVMICVENDVITVTVFPSPEIPCQTVFLP